MKKTVVELFAGVGGFRCGLNNVSLENDVVTENNDWSFVWSNQWEPSTKTQDAYNCYIKRFGNQKENVNKDIATIDKKDIPDHTLLCGGFPCQDYSVAHSLSSEKGIEGKKGVLWWQIVEILETKKSPFVFLENVDRLLISPAKQRGRDFAIMLKTFFDNGYAVQWQVINAADYGFPQKRKRIFIFACRKSTKYFSYLQEKNLKDIICKYGIFQKAFPHKENNSHEEKTFDLTTFKDVVDVSDNFRGAFLNSGVMIDGKIFTTKTESISEEITPLKNILVQQPVASNFFLKENEIERFKYLKGTKRIPRKKPNGEKYIYSEGQMAFPDSLDAPARTMLTSESTVNRSTHVVKDVVSQELRYLTPIEAERINCFPDDWTNTGMTIKKRYFMMGNALVVGIIKRIEPFITDIINLEE